MGYLYYGNNSYSVKMDDRPLSHLKVALLTLLRADRSVAFSFVRGNDTGGGRETLWITPTTDIRFLFLGSKAPVINEVWVREIIETAGSARGMHLMPEPASERLASLAAV